MTSSASAEPADGAKPRNLVVCLDGTTNEPETGCTNVARMFDVGEKNARQLVYYDPGSALWAPRPLSPPGPKHSPAPPGWRLGMGFATISNRLTPGSRISIVRATGFSCSASPVEPIPLVR